MEERVHVFWLTPDLQANVLNHRVETSLMSPPLQSHLGCSSWQSNQDLLGFV